MHMVKLVEESNDFANVSNKKDSKMKIMKAEKKVLREV